MVKKILIFSDSHGKNQEMEKIVKESKPDIVIHAGDYCCDIEELKEYIDYIVAGNNDFIGEHQIYFEIDGLRFFLTHGHSYIQSFCSPYDNSKKILNAIDNKEIDVIVFGHSHIESVEKIENVLVINPGSITSPRNKSKKKTYAIIEIENSKIINQDFNKIIKYIQE